MLYIWGPNLPFLLHPAQQHSSPQPLLFSVTNWRNYLSIFAEGLLKEDTIWRMRRSWGARLHWLSLSLITTCSDLLSALCSLRGEKQTRGRDAIDLTTVFHSMTVPLLLFRKRSFSRNKLFYRRAVNISVTVFSSQCSFTAELRW